MLKLEYKGKHYTVQELSELSGISKSSLRDRLRRGYTVEQAIKWTPVDESITEFCDASYYRDWIGISNVYLYKIYTKWCVSYEYTPLGIKGFTRQLMSVYPNLKIVPTRRKGGYCRIIRERN